VKTRTRATIKITQPRPLPGDVKWEPPFKYDCSRGHEIHASKAVDACPMYRRGQPCDGTLKRFGIGARS